MLIFISLNEHYSYSEQNKDVNMIVLLGQYFAHMIKVICAEQ